MLGKWGSDPSATRFRVSLQGSGQTVLQEEQVPVEKRVLGSSKGEGSTEKGLERPSRPGESKFGGRVRVWLAPAPPQALTLGTPHLLPARTEAWPGVPRGALGRLGAERSSPAMCWRRASSRCVDSTSPMAKRSRGPIRPPQLRETRLAPWSSQVPLPTPAAPQPGCRLRSSPIPPRSLPRPSRRPQQPFQPALGRRRPPRPAPPG